MKLGIALHVLGLDSEDLDRAFDVGEIQTLEERGGLFHRGRVSESRRQSSLPQQRTPVYP
jgi:hypothetical protein